VTLVKVSMFCPDMLTWMDGLREDVAIRSDTMVKFRHFRAFFTRKRVSIRVGRVIVLLVLILVETWSLATRLNR
jgi:hypothetical protein